MTDWEYMRLALQIASAVEGRTWPNPMVGAVVVKEGRIVGMGAHLRAGEPHAEVHALHMAGEQAKGGTLYVTLEPCSHFGKTPPCANLVIDAGIARVVIAMLDPNPLVAGRGAERIRHAGIEVETGLLEEEAMRMNEVWLTNIKQHRPFVWMKAAMTLDGKIAASGGDSKWISHEATRNEVHKLRNLANAILVGSGTVLADDPLLTTRLPHGGRNPLRVVLDSRLRIPETAQVLSPDAPTLVVCGQQTDQEKADRLSKRGIEVLQLELQADRIPLRRLLTELQRRGVALLLVEGGGEVHGSFLQAGLVDKVTMYVAPKLIGGSGPTPVMGSGFPLMRDAVELDNLTVETIGNDFAISGYPKEKGK
jgi:diaminohydroxyphosphoribosylaminopyrimidine deaminase/5-amino-6-(5-phosphoribosylamino)uracil reductase